MRRVVVTGFGAYTPIGNTEKEIKETIPFILHQKIKSLMMR